MYKRVGGRGEEEEGELIRWEIAVFRKSRPRPVLQAGRYFGKVYSQKYPPGINADSFPELSIAHETANPIEHRTAGFRKLDQIWDVSLLASIIIGTLARARNQHRVPKQSK
jgi:hypothetical protein